VRIADNGNLGTPRRRPRATLFVAGDLVPGSRTEGGLPDVAAPGTFAALGPILDAGHGLLFNLETPLCRSGNPITKCGANFRAAPEVAPALAAAGLSIAALANNHILDFGPEGLQETLTALDTAGIAHVGAGLDAATACRPLKLDLNGLAVTILNWAEGEFSRLQPGSGGAAPIDAAANDAAIGAAAADSDCVIVSVHAGNEYLQVPSPWLQGLYRGYIEAGAAAVVGSHPHIPQGLEWYRDGLIVYSMGDFHFQYGGDPGTCVTHLLALGLDDGGLVSVRTQPLRKRLDGRLVPLAADDRAAFVAHLNALSAPLTDPRQLQRLWEQDVLRKLARFYGPMLRRQLPRALGRPQDRGAAGFLFNMLDCPSHALALQTAFGLMQRGEARPEAEAQETLAAFDQALEALNGWPIPELHPTAPWHARMGDRIAKRLARPLRRRVPSRCRARR
jgi:poly-gamma-glutamate synthesis protein (capsule biosynthesis protein)